MMKRFFKISGYVLGVLFALIAGFALYVQIKGIPMYEAENVVLKVDVTPRLFAGELFPTASRPHQYQESFAPHH